MKYAAEDWPHGLRCAACHRRFVDDQPIAERLDGFQDDVPMVVITCVECDLVGAPIREAPASSGEVARAHTPAPEAASP